MAFILVMIVEMMIVTLLVLMQGIAEVLL